MSRDVNGSLVGKVVVVTGGGSGIGRATAQELGKAGASVAVADMNINTASASAEEIIASGGDAISIQVDVAQIASVEEMIDKVVDRYGRLDGAFNNAGIFNLGSTVEETEESWDKIIDVNLKGVWLCMKFQINHMLTQGTGAVVNTSSVAGLVGTDWGMAAYHASKHGVIGLTKAAALENAARGIRVNAVCPGTIRTPLAGAPFSEDQEMGAALHHPINRIGEPQEVAATVTWLLSEASSFVTGHALAVDGGWTAR